MAWLHIRYFPIDQDGFIRVVAETAGADRTGKICKLELIHVTGHLDIANRKFAELKNQWIGKPAYRW